MSLHRRFPKEHEGLNLEQTEQGAINAESAIAVASPFSANKTSEEFVAPVESLKSKSTEQEQERPAGQEGQESESDKGVETPVVYAQAVHVQTQQAQAPQPQPQAEQVPAPEQDAAQDLSAAPVAERPRLSAGLEALLSQSGRGVHASYKQINQAPADTTENADSKVDNKAHEAKNEIKNEAKQSKQDKVEAFQAQSESEVDSVGTNVGADTDSIATDSSSVAIDTANADTKASAVSAQKAEVSSAASAPVQAPEEEFAPVYPDLVSDSGQEASAKSTDSSAIGETTQATSAPITTDSDSKEKATSGDSLDHSDQVLEEAKSQVNTPARKRMSGLEALLSQSGRGAHASYKQINQAQPDTSDTKDDLQADTSVTTERAKVDKDAAKLDKDATKADNVDKEGKEDKTEGLQAQTEGENVDAASVELVTSASATETTAQNSDVSTSATAPVQTLKSDRKRMSGLDALLSQSGRGAHASYKQINQAQSDTSDTKDDLQADTSVTTERAKVDKDAAKLDKDATKADNVDKEGKEDKTEGLQAQTEGENVDAASVKLVTSTSATETTAQNSDVSTSATAPAQTLKSDRKRMSGLDALLSQSGRGAHASYKQINQAQSNTRDELQPDTGVTPDKEDTSKVDKVGLAAHQAQLEGENVDSASVELVTSVSETETSAQDSDISTSASASTQANEEGSADSTLGSALYSESDLGQGASAEDSDLATAQAQKPARKRMSGLDALLSQSGRGAHASHGQINKAQSDISHTNDSKDGLQADTTSVTEGDVDSADSYSEAHADIDNSSPSAASATPAHTESSVGTNVDLDSALSSAQAKENEVSAANASADSANADATTEADIATVADISDVSSDKPEVDETYSASANEHDENKTSTSKQEPLKSQGIQKSALNPLLSLAGRGALVRPSAITASQTMGDTVSKLSEDKAAFSEPSLEKTIVTTDPDETQAQVQDVSDVSVESAATSDSLEQEEVKAQGTQESALNPLLSLAGRGALVQPYGVETHNKEASGAASNDPAHDVVEGDADSYDESNAETNADSNDESNAKASAEVESNEFARVTDVADIADVVAEPYYESLPELALSQNKSNNEVQETHSGTDKVAPSTQSETNPLLSNPSQLNPPQDGLDLLQSHETKHSQESQDQAVLNAVQNEIPHELGEPEDHEDDDNDDDDSEITTSHSVLVNKTPSPLLAEVRGESVSESSPQSTSDIADTSAQDATAPLELESEGNLHADFNATQVDADALVQTASPVAEANYTHVSTSASESADSAESETAENIETTDSPDSSETNASTKLAVSSETEGTAKSITAETAEPTNAEPVETAENEALESESFESDFLAHTLAPDLSHDLGSDQANLESAESYEHLGESLQEDTATFHKLGKPTKSKAHFANAQVQDVASQKVESTEPTEPTEPTEDFEDAFEYPVPEVALAATSPMPVLQDDLSDALASNAGFTVPSDLTSVLDTDTASEDKSAIYSANIAGDNLALNTDSNATDVVDNNTNIKTLSIESPNIESSDYIESTHSDFAQDSKLDSTLALDNGEIAAGSLGDDLDTVSQLDSVSGLVETSEFASDANADIDTDKDNLSGVTALANIDAVEADVEVIDIETHADSNTEAHIGSHVDSDFLSELDSFAALDSSGELNLETDLAPEDSADSHSVESFDLESDSKLDSKLDSTDHAASAWDWETVGTGTGADTGVDTASEARADYESETDTDSAVGSTLSALSATTSGEDKALQSIGVDKSEESNDTHGTNATREAKSTRESNAGSEVREIIEPIDSNKTSKTKEIAENHETSKERKERGARADAMQSLEKEEAQDNAEDRPHFAAWASALDNMDTLESDSNHVNGVSKINLNEPESIESYNSQTSLQDFNQVQSAETDYKKPVSDFDIDTKFALDFVASNHTPEFVRQDIQHVDKDLQDNSVSSTSALTENKSHHDYKDSEHVEPTASQVNVEGQETTENAESVKNAEINAEITKKQTTVESLDVVVDSKLAKPSVEQVQSTKPVETAKAVESVKLAEQTAQTLATEFNEPRELDEFSKPTELVATVASNETALPIETTLQSEEVMALATLDESEFLEDALSKESVLSKGEFNSVEGETKESKDPDMIDVLDEDPLADLRRAAAQAKESKAKQRERMALDPLNAKDREQDESLSSEEMALKLRQEQEHDAQLAALKQAVAEVKAEALAEAKLNKAKHARNYEDFDDPLVALKQALAESSENSRNGTGVSANSLDSANSQDSSLGASTQGVNQGGWGSREPLIQEDPVAALKDVLSDIKESFDKAQEQEKEKEQASTQASAQASTQAQNSHVGANSSLDSEANIGSDTHADLLEESQEPQDNLSALKQALEKSANPDALAKLSQLEQNPAKIKLHTKAAQNLKQSYGAYAEQARQMQQEAATKSAQSQGHSQQQSVAQDQTQPKTKPLSARNKASLKAHSNTKSPSQGQGQFPAQTQGQSGQVHNGQSVSSAQKIKGQQDSTFSRGQGGSPNSLQGELGVQGKPSAAKTSGIQSQNPQLARGGTTNNSATESTGEQSFDFSLDSQRKAAASAKQQSEFQATRMQMLNKLSQTTPKKGLTESFKQEIAAKVMSQAPNVQSPNLGSLSSSSSSSKATLSDRSSNGDMVDYVDSSVLSEANLSFSDSELPTSNLPSELSTNPSAIQSEDRGAGAFKSTRGDREALMAARLAASERIAAGEKAAALAQSSKPKVRPVPIRSTQSDLLAQGSTSARPSTVASAATPFTATMDSLKRHYRLPTEAAKGFGFHSQDPRYKTFHHPDMRSAKYINAQSFSERTGLSADKGNYVSRFSLDSDGRMQQVSNSRSTSKIVWTLNGGSNKTEG